MRLLLIVQDPRYRALIRHHVTCEWPDADVVIRSGREAGQMPPEFLAQGYDVVLLDEEWLGGQGLAWLESLGARRGFAPVVFFTTQEGGDVARRARILGAFSVLSKRDFRA